MHPSPDMENDQAMGNLSAALKAAARAHLECAEANRKVALGYMRASAEEHNAGEHSDMP